MKTQGWTSRNKNVNDCTKIFQFKTTPYKHVIKWIPFNRLDNVQIVGDRFSAIWLDGKRCVDEDGQNNECTQSRMPSYKVELKTLTMITKFTRDVKRSKIINHYYTV